MRSKTTTLDDFCPNCSVMMFLFLQFITGPAKFDLLKAMHTKIDPGKIIAYMDPDFHSELALLLPLANRKWFLRLILFPFKVVKCLMN